nr:hypothetical protein [Microbispora sp. GKU 823]
MAAWQGPQHAQRVGVGQVQVVDGEEGGAGQRLQQPGGHRAGCGGRVPERGLVHRVEQVGQDAGRLAAQRPERLDERGVGAPAVQFAGLAAEHAEALQPRRGLTEQMGLPDAGLAEDEDGPRRLRKGRDHLAERARAALPDGRYVHGWPSLPSHPSRWCLLRTRRKG